MNKRPANRDGKSIPKANGDQSVPAIAKAKTKYGQLVGIVVLCSSVCLLAAYLFPYPEDSLLSKEEADVKSEIPLEQANTVGVLAEKSSLTLPKESLYTDSSQEKKRLLNEVEKAVEAYPNDASILHIAGLVYAELQQSERALELLQKCNEIDGNRSDVVVALADQFTQLGKHNEATLVLEQAIGRGLETEPLLSAMGEIYSQAGKMEEAAKVLERAVALASADPMVSHKSQAPLRLSQALTQLGRFEEAETQARVAVSIQPSNEANYLALANALMRQNKREEALEVRNRIPKPELVIPGDDQAFELSFRAFAGHHYSLLGAAYAAHNEHANAEKMFVRSLELEPESAKTALLLADLLRVQKRTLDAIAVYKRLLEIKPDDLINYHNLASLAFSIKDLALTEVALRSATKVDASGNADLRLAVFLLGIGKTDSLSYAKIAVERLGTLDAYLVLMDASRASGDTASAYNAYLKAKAIAPNDPRLANFKP